MGSVLNLLNDFKILIRKKYFALSAFTGLIIVISFLEGISLGALLPLMNVILDETKKQIYLDKLNTFFDMQLGLPEFTMIFLLGILIIFVLKNAFVILGAYGQYYLSQMMRIDWQQRIFNNYLRKKYEFFVSSQTGDLIQKQMVHTMTCESAILFLCAGARDILSAVGILVVLAFISFKWTVIVLGILLVSFAVFVVISKRRIYTTAHEYADLQRHAYSLVAEAINGIKEIKLFNAERFFSLDFQKTVNGQAKIYIKNATLGMTPPPIMQIVTITILVVGVLISSKFGINSIKILPLVVVFGGGLHRLIRLASSVNSSVMQLSVALPSVEIVSRVLASCHDDEQGHHSALEELQKIEAEFQEAPQIDFNDQIALQNIAFSYPGTKRNQLDNLNIELQKGKFYGIVGPSGCGKTTLVDLLIKLHPIQKGDIAVDGKSFKEFSSPSWRKLFGFVSQNPFIFSGTVEQNIAFAVNPSEIDNDRVTRAAKLAGLEGVINKLEKGTQTFVGEKGYKLSGGERQRLSIARAIYRDPAVYIFDEATSSLDSESEKKIQEAIESLSHERKTVVAIAHRLSTIINADELIVMNDGKVVEKGDHASLMKQNGFYAKLYKIQHKV